MLAFTVAALAIACPPLVEENDVPKLLGEKCGGMCDSFGKCAPGLECVTEEMVQSPFSFAIMMGRPKVAGKCKMTSASVESVPPVEHDSKGTEENRRQLQFGSMVGGQHQADVASAEVVAAAKHGMVTIMRESNALTPPTLSRIVSATTQVVAGIKYTLELELTDGSHHRVVLLDQAWMTPRFSVLEHTNL